MFRVAFLGRGSLGVRVLRRLVEEPEIEVTIVLTCRPSPEVGASENDFAELARAANVAFHRVDDLDPAEWTQALGETESDLGVGISWLHAIDERVIATMRHGILNIHGGMLPEYRGNACGNWAILNGESHMGLTVHLMAGRLDSGPIVRQTEIPITDTTTIGDLVTTAEDLGVDLMLAAVADFQSGTAEVREQDEESASYCFPRIPRDGEVDWNASAEDVARLVRATGHPYPGAYSWYSDVRDEQQIKRLTIWAGHAADLPLAEAHAVPGHVVRLDEATRGVICGDRRVLVLDDVSVDDVDISAADAFRTVRQRLGLDVQQHVAELTERLDALERQVAALTRPS